jgi:hypothetical protein
MTADLQNQVKALADRVTALEAESEIRALVARYMEICDALDADAPMDELGQLFATDAIWVGKGKKYDATFGGHEGRDSIVGFLNTYREPTPHFAGNVHILGCENVTVDGQQATGTWVMLQTPTFNEGGAFLMAARLNLNFCLEQSRWRIHRFATENLFSRPVESGWNIDAPIPVPGVAKKGLDP